MAMNATFNVDCKLVCERGDIAYAHCRRSSLTTRQAHLAGAVTTKSALINFYYTLDILQFFFRIEMEAQKLYGDHTVRLRA